MGTLHSHTNITSPWITLCSEMPGAPHCIFIISPKIPCKTFMPKPVVFTYCFSHHCRAATTSQHVSQHQSMWDPAHRLHPTGRHNRFGDFYSGDCFSWYQACMEYRERSYLPAAPTHQISRHTGSLGCLTTTLYSSRSPYNLHE